MCFSRVFIALIVATFIAAGCGRQDGPAPTVQKKSDPADPGPRRVKPANFQTPWQTESEYIVTMVAADLVEMAYYAKYARMPSQALPVEVSELGLSTEALPRYQVKVQLGEAGEALCELPITGAIWAPATYQPLGRVLFEKLRLSDTGESSADESLLEQLQDLRVETLARLDGELSALLAEEFTVANRHEEAALLLGAFALRQTSGVFFQLRAELCRMTAHLAFAGALRSGQEPDATGRLAEAMLTVLYNNQVDALKALAAMSDDGDVGVWKRVLRMRATGDFRSYDGNRAQTLAEKLEWFRSRGEAVAMKRAWAEVELSEEERQLADWTRVLSAEQSSVNLGHVVLDAGFSAEFREAALAYEAEEGKALPAEELVKALNTEPQRCLTGEPGGTARVKVIGWGTWAACLQRQLCQIFTANFIFLRDWLAVPNDARQYQEAIDREFWGLRLYPFVRRQCAPDYAYYKKAQEEQMSIVRRSPHIVPAEAWNYISFENRLGPIYWPPPHPFINEWHRPNPVPGTAYNPRPRMAHLSLTERSDAFAQLERMHELAPYDQVICRNLLRIRDGEKQTAELVEKTYAAGLDFQTSPLYTLARLTQDPAAKEKWISKSAALDPSDYRQLARFYIEQRRVDDAAQAYLKWIDNEIDEVAVSNEAEWLIKYFERNGDIVAARNLADRAADAYSSAGLLAKARLLERQHETQEALEFYRKQAERYADYGPMIGFLNRLNDVGGKEYTGLRDSILKKHLPAGLAIFDRSVQSPPKIGVRVPQQGTGEWRPGSRVEAAGLRRGDIVVAVRGYRVADWNSFKVLRTLEPEVPYVMTVWRDDKYLELAPLDPKYRFGINLVDYRAP
jgi:hypothetical protein